MDSVELQRKAPAGAVSWDSALQGTIVLRPSRTISSRGGFKVNGRGLMGSAWVYTILYSVHCILLPIYHDLSPRALAFPISGGYEISPLKDTYS